MKPEASSRTGRCQPSTHLVTARPAVLDLSTADVRLPGRDIRFLEQPPTRWNSRGSPGCSRLLLEQEVWGHQWTSGANTFGPKTLFPGPSLSVAFAATPAPVVDTANHTQTTMTYEMTTVRSPELDN